MGTGASVLSLAAGSSALAASKGTSAPLPGSGWPNGDVSGASFAVRPGEAKLGSASVEAAGVAPVAVSPSAAAAFGGVGAAARAGICSAAFMLASSVAWIDSAEFLLVISMVATLSVDSGR